MRVGIMGINHKQADLKLRELLAQECQRRFHPGASVHGDHQLVLLSTCNRTEVYFSSQDLSATHSYLLEIMRRDVNQDFDQKLYTFFGRDAFRHLARVTAGLDSAILFETEIQGQVRAAYQTAIEARRLPEELHFLFQKTLQIGKQVRAQLPLGRGMPDLEHAILETGEGFFSHIQNAKILFFGASEINLKIAGFLQRQGLKQITLCNRTHRKALAWAEKLQVGVIEWNQLDEWHQFDWIVCGTKAPRPILEAHQIPRGMVGRKLLIDLSVPRNIAPALALHPQLSLFNIDHINSGLRHRRRAALDRLANAETLVDDCSDRQLASFQQKVQERQRRAVAI